ncbi:hypothetical protein Taro_038891 [Colocasia esculenta]|uniref:Uncharacterized protein n=1 Tax=Colocasia esculenta TaxID=4460 RepID=A0A843W7W9_COLES|nr:hypothetical protein [Colocasia esculenta]
MASKGKAVTVAGASGVTVAAAQGPRCCHYNRLRECFRIGDEYEIIDAKEGESYLVNKPGCLPLSVDYMEVELRLPFPEVAKALLNRWGVLPIQLTLNTWRIKQIRGSADVFRAHFKLSASRSSRTDLYYAKHRTDMMHIQLSGKYSNNKGWMDRLFFIPHRDGAEWGFPTVVRSAQKDSFPKLIQDEARASDSLVRAGMRNGEGYVTEFSLVRHGLSKQWIAAKLEAGSDQEANKNFAEQIPVMAHMVYEGDDVAAVVRVPSVVRVGTAVTTTLVAPSPAKGCPESTRVLEKGPEKIRLKKKATIKVVSSDALQPSFEEGEGASRPSAAMKKRPMLLDEGVEVEDQLRARKKKKLVRAAPQQSEEEIEEEVDGGQLLLLKKRKATGTAEQEAPWMPSAARPEVAQRMATELGLVVLSNGRKCPSRRAQTRAAKSELLVQRRRAPEAPSKILLAMLQRTLLEGARVMKRPLSRGRGPLHALRFRREMFPRRRLLQPWGPLLPERRRLRRRKLSWPPCPPPKMVAVVETLATTLVPTVVGVATRGAKEMALATEGHEEIADPTAETAGRAEVSNERPDAAEEAVSPEEDRRPLSAVLKGKSSELPSQAMLEAALGRLGSDASRFLPPCLFTSYLDRMARCQDLSPEKTPEHSSTAYRLGHLAEHDDDGNVDVGALVDGIANSTAVLKRLSLRAQHQSHLWEAESAFCNDLMQQHKARETELLGEVSSLKDALRTSELNVAIAREEKEAIARILADAEERAVAKYKAGPSFKEDLKQFGAHCYKVGLDVGQELGQKLATTERARAAFEAAVGECRRRTNDARLDGVRFAQFISGRMPSADDDVGPSEQAP